MTRAVSAVRVLYFNTYSGGGCLPIASKEMQVNEQIRDSEVRVIGDGGEQLGVMSSRDAQRLADEKNLDLVKIAPTATPPVCRIMDYGKYRFEQAKRERKPGKISTSWKSRKSVSV